MGFDPADPVSEKSKKVLGDKASLFGIFWQSWYEWMLDAGKNPSKGRGLSESQARNYVRRLDQIHRVIWDEFDIDPLKISPDHASAFLDLLAEDEVRSEAGDPYAENSKRKFKNALQKYADWQEEQLTGDKWDRWDPHHKFRQSNFDSADIFSLKEVGKLTEAAQNLDELPQYDEVSPEDRDQINARLAQRFHKPKSMISKEDWDHEENGAKIPSLVMTAQDIGLPPIEIQRANTGWVNFDDGTLEIPDELASKQRESDDLSLSRSTLKHLSEWIDERDEYEKYDGREALWLNQRGNRYTSDTLNDLLDRLCEKANLDTENRKIEWYSIRRTAGTYVTEYNSLNSASALLRHKTLGMTKKHYKDTVAEVQRATVGGIRELAEARVSEELSEAAVGKLLSGDTTILLELLMDRDDDSGSLL